jgi:D-amino-acid dehydrogenase
MRLAQKLGVKLPLQGGKGYSLTIPDVRPLPRIGAILSEARIAMTPMDGALRFGGTMELAGIDESINPPRLSAIIKSVARYLPDFTADRFEHAQVLSGLRPCSPDGLPYIGRLPSFTNVCAATGHAMMGVSLGPITGKLIAEIVSGETPSVPIDGFRPDRYA